MLEPVAIGAELRRQPQRRRGNDFHAWILVHSRLVRRRYLWRVQVDVVVRLSSWRLSTDELHDLTRGVRGVYKKHIFPPRVRSGGAAPVRGDTDSTSSPPAYNRGGCAKPDGSSRTAAASEAKKMGPCSPQQGPTIWLSDRFPEGFRSKTHSRTTRYREAFAGYFRCVRSARPSSRRRHSSRTIGGLRSVAKVECHALDLNQDDYEKNRKTCFRRRHGLHR